MSSEAAIEINIPRQGKARAAGAAFSPDAVLMIGDCHCWRRGK
jgi:hypothetical protein